MRKTHPTPVANFPRASRHPAQWPMSRLYFLILFNSVCFQRHSLIRCRISHMNSLFFTFALSQTTPWPNITCFLVCFVPFSLPSKVGPSGHGKSIFRLTASHVAIASTHNLLESNAGKTADFVIRILVTGYAPKSVWRQVAEQLLI